MCDTLAMWKKGKFVILHLHIRKKKTIEKKIIECKTQMLAKWMWEYTHIKVGHRLKILRSEIKYKTKM